MKKKIIAIVMICILMFSLVGCGTTYDEAETNGWDYGNGYFTLVKQWGGGIGASYQIVYANDTKVMYFIETNTHAGGMTPLYNADGTLQIYDGE